MYSTYFVRILGTSFIFLDKLKHYFVYIEQVGQITSINLYLAAMIYVENEDLKWWFWVGYLLRIKEHLCMRRTT